MTATLDGNFEHYSPNISGEFLYENLSLCTVLQALALSSAGLTKEHES